MPWPPPRRSSVGPLRLALLAVAVFAAAAVGLVVGLPGGDDEPAGADAPTAAAPEAAAPGGTPIAATQDDIEQAGAQVPAPNAHTPIPREPTEPSAPKNTMSAEAPPYRPAQVHEIFLDMTEKTVEIAPGTVVKVWTFGDQVPGPVIRVRVGDTVRTTIRNSTDLPHSIDYHAARIAPSRAFIDVAPGEEFTYEFTPQDPGVFLYHCGTAPVLHHIANGMYGMIIVEPEGGLPPADRELAFVQSDFYPSDTPDQLADNDKLMTGIPDVVAFNGYAGQYMQQPITARPGEKIRAFVLAAGPNLGMSFHVVGTIFDRVLIDGNPRNLQVGTQAVNLSGAQGAIAEFTLAEEGLYPFVNHEFTNAAKGAAGLLRTPNAPEAPAGGH